MLDIIQFLSLNFFVMFFAGDGCEYNEASVGLCLYRTGVSLGGDCTELAFSSQSLSGKNYYFIIHTFYFRWTRVLGI